MRLTHKAVKDRFGQVFNHLGLPIQGDLALPNPGMYALRQWDPATYGPRIWKIVRIVDKAFSETDIFTSERKTSAEMVAFLDGLWIGMRHQGELTSALDAAMSGLLDGRFYESKNPYSRPEVKEGLTVLAKVREHDGSWMDTPLYRREEHK
jgi:hypothetical protein